VDRSPRVDIVKGENLFVLIDDFGGNLLGNDLAKNAIRVVVSD
jgi:hypothetical protein